MLGFSSNKFQVFKDENGNTRSDVLKFESRTFKDASVTIAKLATPALVAAARKYFDCDTLDGIELEVIAAFFFS